MLYELYYAYGIGICYRYAYSREDALEILNDSFMKVFENIGRYDPQRPFKPWFRKIIIHKAIDYYRRNLRKVPADSLEEDGGQVHQTEQVDQLELEDLKKLLDHLPELQRMVFNLYEIEGYAHDEIAGMLGVSSGTSRSYLTRAKEKLRAKYKALYKGNYEQII